MVREYAIKSTPKVGSQRKCKRNLAPCGTKHKSDRMKYETDDVSVGTYAVFTCPSLVGVVCRASSAGSLGLVWEALIGDEDGLLEPLSSFSSSRRAIPSAVYGSMSKIHGNCQKKTSKNLFQFSSSCREFYLG